MLVFNNIVCIGFKNIFLWKVILGFRVNENFILEGDRLVSKEL